ncbi:MAG: M15 family metallopeptidase [Clostridia bacterium]|nr:M15 family metallopeptidase [Clostridia bacterium]
MPVHKNNKAKVTPTQSSKKRILFLLCVVLCVLSVGCAAETTEQAPTISSVSQSAATGSAVSAPAESESTVIETTENDNFVLITDVIPDAILEIRYYSTFNFVGERINGYQAPVAYLTKEAASALKNVSDEVMKQGYRIKIYDAYRPQTAVDHFKAWAEDLEATEMKSYFYPEVDKSELFDKGYIAAKSGHSRGSTVDLTLVDMKTGREVDMGGGFDYFGELSHPDYTETLTQEQIDNRMILRQAMVDNGFRPLPEEWWHFTLENEPYSDTYFDFAVDMPE